MLKIQLGSSNNIIQINYKQRFMDYPYLLFYFVQLYLAFQYWKKPDERLVKWSIFLQFAFFALRAPVVGADTWNYVRYLDGERNFYNYDPRPLEPAFIIYREVMVWLHCNRLACMVINTIVSCYPIYLMVKKYSTNVPFTMAMFSIFNVYYVYWCGLRQIIGLAILFMGLLYVLEEKKRKWIVFAGCAVLGYNFHTSIAVYVAIFLGVYFINFKSRTIVIAAIAVSAAIGIVLQSFNVMDAFNFFLSLNVESTERLEGYLGNTDDVNEITSIFISLRPSLIAIGIYALMDKDKLNHWFSLIYVSGVIIDNLFISVPMIGRLTGGLTIFGPIVITWVFSSKYYAVAQYRKWVNTVIVLFLLYFSQMYVKINMDDAIDLFSSGRMHPYQFIWEDYSNHPSCKYFN